MGSDIPFTPGGMQRVAFRAVQMWNRLVDLTQQVKALTEQVKALADRMTVVERRTTAVAPRIGPPVPVGRVSLNATVPVTVPFTPAVDLADYAVVPSLYGETSLIGNLTIVGVTARTTTSVTFAVKAGLLAVAAGATLGVTVFPASS